MPVPLANKVEVKLAFVSEDTGKALALLGLSEPAQEEKSIHFFDTGNLDLFDQGLILRTRQPVPADGRGDATLKVRGPNAPDAADRFLATAGDDAKFEGDQNVGRDEIPSFSMTTEVGSESVSAVVADPGKLESVLNEAGRTLLGKFVGPEAVRAEILRLGPIRSRSWKWKPAGFSSKITAELWEVAGVRLLEISDKAPRAEASALAEQLKKLVPEASARQLDTSKTRFALTLLRPQSHV